MGLQQGCRAVFEGKLTGVPTPTVRWTWRGQPLSLDHKGGRVVSYDSATGLVRMVVSDLGPGDEGQYDCRADNVYGDTTCSIVISPDLVGGHRKKTVTLPKGSCRTNLKACHIDSDDYADYARVNGL